MAGHRSKHYSGVRPDVKKIMYVSTPTEFGGGEVYILGLMDSLVDVDTWVMTSLTQLRRAAEGAGARTLPLFVPVKFYSRRHMVVFLLLLPVYWAQLVVAILIARPGLIHVQSNEERLSVWIPALLFRVPVVWTVHGPIDVAEGSIYASCLRAAATSVNKIVCVSEYVRASVIQAGLPEEKCRVVYNGADLDKFRRTSLRPRTAVTFIGRLEAVKNPAFFIELAARLGQTHPTLEFSLVGDGSMRGLCAAQAARLDMGQRIDILGYEEDIRPRLERSLALVIPSIDEGLSITAIEAMAMEVPVVASRVGGLLEVVSDGNSGFLCELCLEEFRARVEALVCDPGLIARMGRTARRDAEERFSLVRMARETLAIYEQASVSFPVAGLWNKFGFGSCRRGS